jgi:tRNA (cmo5U34)-methyltransferase
MENYFDNAARDWDKNVMHIKRTGAIAGELIKEIESGKKLRALEFGAGTGLLSIALKDYFSEIILIDSSSEMVKTTKEKLVSSGISHLHPVLFDLESCDYTADTFDFIFSQMAMHHVGETEPMICKFHKLLNNGGKLAIADLYAEDGAFHDSGFTGHWGFDPEFLVEILSKNKFKDIKFSPCFVIEKITENKTVKKYPLFLMTGVK